jgi:hypothetical protein
MEAWAREAFIAATAEQAAVMNATAIGGVRVLDQLIEQVTEYQKYEDGKIEFIKGGRHG